MNTLQKIKQKKARAKKLLIDQAENIANWRNGKRANSLWQLPCMLRINNDNETIETSQGANIPLSFAPKLWKLINMCIKKGASYSDNLRLGHYSLNHNDDFIRYFNLEIETEDFDGQSSFDDDFVLMANGQSADYDFTLTNLKNAAYDSVSKSWYIETVNNEQFTIKLFKIETMTPYDRPSITINNVDIHLLDKQLQSLIDVIEMIREEVVTETTDHLEGIENMLSDMIIERIK